MLVLLLLILLLIFFYYKTTQEYEHFAGALTQLYAKGAEDRYLTNSDHIYNYLPFETVWNNPTRIPYNYYYLPYYYQRPLYRRHYKYSNYFTPYLFY